MWTFYIPLSLLDCVNYMAALLFVGIGGFFGAIARYLLANQISRWFTGLFNLTLPVGTLFVNITGSFLLALFVVWSLHRTDFSLNTRLLVGTGFFGAYTTFSTFATESIGLFQRGEWAAGIGNIVLTNLLCLAGVLLALALGQRLWASA